MPVVPGAESFSRDGCGVAVLLAHSFPGTPAELLALAGALAGAGFTVRLPRLPGHGTTWRELAHTRAEDWYAALDRELADLHARGDRVIGVGLGSGGTLLARLAQERGPWIAGIAMINPVFDLSDRRLRLLRGARRMVESIPTPAPDILRADGSAWLRTDRIPLACLDSLRSAWQITLADLPEITMPALLLRSTQDRVVPAAAQEEVLARISSADVSEVVLPASGHLATLDHDAALIADEILAFVARVGGECAPSAGRAP